MYGLMILTGAAAGIGVAVGAKILYIITILPDLIANWNTLIQDVNYLFSLISGGFVFYGGLIGAVIMLSLIHI